MDGPDFVERRKYARSVFTYPVNLKIFSRHNGPLSFNAYMIDLSTGGARIQFEDRYGRLDLEKLPGSKIKILICMPNGEKITSLSSVKRVIKAHPQSFYVEIGIEFENLEDWQADAIEKLIRLKNKDQSMMWNLWESYENQL
jgi:hypothetical protein